LWQRINRCNGDSAEPEQIGMFGEINSGEDKVKITKQVSISQQDIREFQLAKAAIAAGIQILLNQLKITYTMMLNRYLSPEDLEIS
jgi:uncharacterized 2Fe-2S/4Fe-4S cluster protein (DUF4445 family)